MAAARLLRGGTKTVSAIVTSILAVRIAIPLRPIFWFARFLTAILCAAWARSTAIISPGISAPPNMPAPHSQVHQIWICADARRPMPKGDLADRRGAESRFSQMEVRRPDVDNVANCVSTAEEQSRPPVPLKRLVQWGDFASACVLSFRRRASTGDARHINRS
jgi:hypothetical protein